MTEINTKPEKPFQERFGELCEEYAHARSDHQRLVNGLYGRNPDDRDKQIISRPAKLERQIREEAVKEILKIDTADRRDAIREMVQTMNFRATFTGQNFAFENVGFVTDILLQALEAREVKVHEQPSE